MKRLFALSLLMALLPMVTTGRKMVVATYNLRYDNKSDVANGNGWNKRLVYISHFIDRQHVDILGTQEGLRHMLDDLRKLQPGYDYIGVGRDDGKTAGEHSAIFYKTSRYELSDHGDFWLSDITDKPNRGWDAALPRICTWGRFREKKTGFSFYCFNLHMDHIGVVARRESARLVLDKIREIAGTNPVILTGDFNADQRDTTYAMLQQSTVLYDAFVSAGKREPGIGTFNNFDTARHTDSRIDHIFLSDAFSVRHYDVPIISYRDTVGAIRRFASDHHPVVAELKY